MVYILHNVHGYTVEHWIKEWESSVYNGTKMINLENKMFMDAVSIKECIMTNFGYQAWLGWPT